MDGLTNILGETTFLVALGVSFLAVLLGASARRVPGLAVLASEGGAVVAVVVFATMWREGALEGAGAVLALGALLVGFGTTRVTRRWAGAALLGIVPGVVLLAVAAERGDAGWDVAVAVAVVAAFAAPAIARGDSTWEGSALGPVAVALAAFGVYACVPDTEQAIPVMAGSVGLAGVAVLVPRAGLGPFGSGAVTALLCWTVAVGGMARSGAIVGGIGCVVAAATTLGYPITTGGRAGRRMALPRFVAAVVTVLLVSRVAGLRESGLEAAAIAVPVLLGHLLVVRRLDQWSGAGRE